MRTAFITGATEGIGYELAKIFAQKKINLILVARNEKRLHDIASDLSGNGIEVMVYAKDLSLMENAVYIYEDIKTKGIAVDYMVNNAGFGINNQYIDIKWEDEHKMLCLNMLTLAYFTKVFAKDMVSRNFGRILNLGSIASFQPGPYMAGYCASKAFVLNLSEAVNYELRKTNVRVTTLCPGVTDTAFHKVANTGGSKLTKIISHASADEVAHYGYKIMMKGQSIGIYGISNKIMIFSIRLIPRGIVTALAGWATKSK